MWPDFCFLSRPWYSCLFIISLPRGWSTKQNRGEKKLVVFLRRPEDLSAWDGAPVLQGDLHPGQQAEADFRGCPADLQAGWRRPAQYRDGEGAAADGEVHTAAACWRWRLLDRASTQPTTPQAGGLQSRMPLTVLLDGWKQGQVQVRSVNGP